MATPLILPLHRAIPLHPHPHLASIQLNGKYLKHSKLFRSFNNNSQLNSNNIPIKTNSTTNNLMMTLTCIQHPQPPSSPSIQHWPSYPRLLKNHKNSTLLSRQHLKNAYMIFTNSLKSKTWSTLHQISPALMTYPRHSGNKTKSGPQLAQWLPMPLAQLTRHSINFFRNPT